MGRAENERQAMTEERCTDCMATQGRNCHCRTFRPKLFWPIVISLLLWAVIIGVAAEVWAML